MRRIFGIRAGLAFLVPAARPAEAGAVAVQPADFAAKADAVLEGAYPADGPGAAVIVTRGGRILYSRGRGLADLESRRPIAPDTIFRLGSITKQFTAAVILQLVGEGRISLDDPISRFFPDYPRPAAGATVRQLLNHTSGIQSYTGIPGWMTEQNTARAYATAEMIAVFRDLPSPTPPGQTWAYNNSGYLLLGAIIEQVTGKSWHEAVVERISRPLGLTTIGYGESIHITANGYTNGPGGTQAPARRIHMSVPHGAGGLVGTVGDLAKWAHALHHGRVVPPALYQEMIKATSLPNGSTVPYGFGLGLDDVRGRPAIGHNGGIFGFSTESIYIPSEDLFIAVFTNSDEPAVHPSIVMRRLAALALGEPFPTFSAVELAPATLEPLLGIYRVGENGPTRRFFARGGKLYTRRDGGPELEAFAAGEDRFFYGPGSLTWFRLERRPDGSHVMHMHQNGATDAEQAIRTGPVPPEAPETEVPATVLQSYAGVYESGGPTVTIALDSGRLTIQLTGQPALPLRPTSRTEFEVVGVGARVVFHEEGGQVNRLVIHQNGQQLPAQRAAR